MRGEGRGEGAGRRGGGDGEGGEGVSFVPRISLSFCLHVNIIIVTVKNRRRD